MRGESIGQAEHRRELGSEQARSQYPDRDRQALAGDRADALALAAAEIVEQFVARELILVGSEVAAERPRRRLIGPGRAAEAEVDPAGKERFERPELLGDGQRRVVGEHDPAGADPDRRSAGADKGQGDRGGGAGDPRHRMMLGHPEAVIAPAFGMAGEVARIAKRLACVGALRDRREVEDREGDHYLQMGMKPARRKAKCA
jgi:hypothetical protein